MPTGKPWKATVKWYKGKYSSFFVPYYCAIPILAAHIYMDPNWRYKNSSFNQLIRILTPMLLIYTLIWFLLGPYMALKREIAYIKRFNKYSSSHSEYYAQLIARLNRMNALSYDLIFFADPSDRVMEMRVLLKEFHIFMDMARRYRRNRTERFWECNYYWREYLGWREGDFPGKEEEEERNLEMNEKQRKIIETHKLALTLFAEKSMSDEQRDIELHNIDWLHLEFQSIIHRRVMEWDDKILDEKFMAILRRHYEFYLRLVPKTEEDQLEVLDKAVLEKRSRGIREEDIRRNKWSARRLNNLKSGYSTSAISVSKVTKRMQAKYGKQELRRQEKKRLEENYKAKKQEQTITRLREIETQKTTTGLHLWERAEVNLPMANIHTAKLFDVKVMVDAGPRVHALFPYAHPGKILKIRYNRDIIEYRDMWDIFHTPRIWHEVADTWNERKYGLIEDSYLWGFEYRLGMQLEECGLMIMGFSEFWVAMVMRFVGGRKDVAVGSMGIGGS
ncbi:1c6478f6-5fe4-4b3c-bc89-15ffff8ab130-CDS [Sclerotinia trifoliorum]|uniref:1c6478f6-5fe4-4b3c-bc89-15ffff8ab130-CDS n=1 Tax=Sclerotinia trifoliorum TaxID=28548 RepID=A0A8H2VY51_9HELO|nr:1c6478f6-5fe4-4b3c-bc89-15ffff8ab130-CDS [Sclerotinia trifoliorum]